MILRLGFATPSGGVSVGTKRGDGVVGRRTWFSWRIRRKSCSFLRLVASSHGEVQSTDSGSSLRRSGEELRTQLEQLQEETEATTSKANTARSRLLRLSEAAEQLQRHAALYLRSGKEDDARELLFQKKKVMQALDKSKNRIELLDLLSRKLCEAISLKEAELIGYVASQSSLTVKDDDDETPIRIVSPKVVSDEEPEESMKTEEHDHKVEDIQEINRIVSPKVVSDEEPEENMKTEEHDHKVEDIQEIKSQNGQTRESTFSEQHDYKVEDIEEMKPQDDQRSESKMDDYVQFVDEGENIDMLTDLTSYKALLEHLDDKFKQIENDVGTLIRLSSLMMESQEREKNKKMKQISEILQDITSIRERLANIIHASSDMNY